MIADSMDVIPDWNLEAFSVEEKYLKDSFMGKPVIPYECLAEELDPSEYLFFVGIGENDLNNLRYRFYTEMLTSGWTPARFISPWANVSGRAIIGKHCFIAENVSIQAGCHIGDDVIILPNSYLAHHARIGSHVFCSGGVNISGFASVGDFSFLGSNAAISNCVEVGERAVVGFGCSCGKDIPDDGIMRGAHCDIESGAREKFNRWHEKAARRAWKIMGAASNGSQEKSMERKVAGSAHCAGLAVFQETAQELIASCDGPEKQDSKSRPGERAEKIHGDRGYQE